MPFHIQLPKLSERSCWIQQQVANDRFPDFVTVPWDCQRTASVSDWVWKKSQQGDTPSLTHALAQLTEIMFPATMKHGRSEVLPCQVLVELLTASAVARLREAQRHPRVPRWAASVLRACPEHVRMGISQPGSDWEKETRALLCEPSSGAAVYCLFSHAGWYIGKANLSRSVGGALMPGLQMPCVEHLRGLLVPAYRDASLPWYGILRRSVGSIRFLPLLCCAHETQALAVESALIRALAPSCNGADAALLVQQSQLLRPDRVTVRRRPPRRLRWPARVKTVWEVPLFAEKLQEAVSDPFHVLTLADFRHVRGSFTMLYREQQLYDLAHFGCVCPISILTPGAYTLFVAYIARPASEVYFPRSWDNAIVARFLYEVAELLEKGMVFGSKRFLASKMVDFLLKLYKLPPIQVPPLVVPEVFRRHISWLRRSVYLSFLQIRNAYARSWLQRHVKITFCKAVRWSSKFNIKGELQKIDREHLLSLGLVELGRLAQLGSLRAIDAPWQLPMWPSARRVQGQTRKGWS